jgi:hypothetical protein
MDPWGRRFSQALKLGPLALIRLRAEVLLDWFGEGELADDKREELLRIASTPKPEDREFLGRFDFIFEEDDD